MTPQMRRAVASLLLRLAGKAQFAKASVCVWAACGHCAAVGAWWTPDQASLPSLRILQDTGSARVASQVLSALAHLAPDLVLPHVHKHFTTALETVTAASQLGPAIQTLSLCVRPLLVAGLAVEAGNGPPAAGADSMAAAALAASAVPATEEQRAAAAQAVASGLCRGDGAGGG